MRIDFITGFPAMFTGPLTESMLKRARQSGHVEFVVHDLRDFAHDRHHTIDDSPYGGGAGMVLKPGPIVECAEQLMSVRSYDRILLTSASGTRLNQPLANELSLTSAIMIICGHYKGVDDRVRQLLGAVEISIGDYVLTGGELAAMVIADAVVRLIPGVMSDGESLLTDSFQSGQLDCPQYTRPAEYRGLTVPEDLLSGDHARVARWRADHAAAITRQRRPDLVDGHGTAG